MIVFRPVLSAVFYIALRAPINAIRAFAKTAPSLVFHTYEGYIQNVFAEEGIPKWQELAEFTVEERRRLGFPPEHPILERTGAFRRALTSSSSPDFVQEQVNLGGDSFTLRFGTTDFRFIEFQRGTPRMPARPIVPDTDVGKREWARSMESALVSEMDARVAEASNG